MMIQVELCMGSSCFARGNHQVLSLLEEYMKTDEWAGKVNIIGHLCMGNCSCGPVVKIDDSEYLGKTDSQIAEIIGKKLHEQ